MHGFDVFFSFRLERSTEKAEEEDERVVVRSYSSYKITLKLTDAECFKSLEILHHFVYCFDYKF